jgi:hypothetical protein
MLKDASCRAKVSRLGLNQHRSTKPRGICNTDQATGRGWLLSGVYSARQNTADMLSDMAVLIGNWSVPVRDIIASLKRCGSSISIS